MSNDKTIIENYELFKSTVDLINKDFEKFKIKDTKAAGIRVKSNILECVKLCNILENQIIDKVKSIPSKHRSDFTLDISGLLPPEMSIQNEENKVEVKVRKPRRANKPKEN